MFKYLISITLLLLLVGCAHQTPVTLKPLSGLALTTNASFTTVEFIDAEILLYQDETLIGSVQRVPVPEPGQTAFDALQEGFVEAQKGSNKPTRLETSADTYAYVVHTPNFSTVFVATQQEPAAWAVVSVKKEHFNPIAASLARIK